MAIDKITGAPNTNISTWSWNEQEKFAPNPMKKEKNPFNSMGTAVGDPKEKYRDKPHMDPDKYAVVLTNLVTKVNEIIDVVNTLPVHPHEPQSHTHTAYATTGHTHSASTTTTGGRKGGLLKRGGIIKESAISRSFKKLRRGGRTTSSKSQPSVRQVGGALRTMAKRYTNQVTLPDGTGVKIPTFPENPPTSTSRDFYTCENDWCCIWDGSTNTPSDIPENNMVYSQADFAYSWAAYAFPMSFYTIKGTIYIDGVPSTNPLGTDHVFHNGGWPNYCMNGWNDFTGNCDAIALLSNGKIIGFDFVNNIELYDDGEQVPIPGIMIPAQTQQGELTLDCYPNWGDSIDNIILYQASTNSWYQLTEQSYNDLWNGEWMEYIGPPCPPCCLMEDLTLDECQCVDYNQDPQCYELYQGLAPINAGVTSIYQDLHFEPVVLKPEPPEPCEDCSQHTSGTPAPWERCWEYSGVGCQWDHTTLECYCNHPDMGCCDPLEQVDPNRCQTNRDCREGSVCRRGQCILLPPTLPDIQGTVGCCQCTSDICNWCWSINNSSDNPQIYNQQFCESMGQGLGNCNWECGGRTRPKPTNRNK